MSVGYLGLKETMKFLDVNKVEIEKLVKTNRLTAYKLGGSHLRFRKDHLTIIKHELELQKERQTVPASGGGLSQFWAFNSFYIVTGAILSGVLIYFLTA